MLVFEETKFGSITISGKLYLYDVYLLVNGTLKRRDKSHSPRIEGHRSLSIWELEKVLKDDPEVLLIGMGQSGVLPMSNDAIEWLEKVKREKNIEVIKMNTPDILGKTNEILKSGKRVVGIFHITC